MKYPLKSNIGMTNIERWWLSINLSHFTISIFFDEILFITYKNCKIINFYEMIEEKAIKDCMVTWWDELLEEIKILQDNPDDAKELGIRF